jgi:hypothetical protein
MLERQEDSQCHQHAMKNNFQLDLPLQRVFKDAKAQKLKVFHVEEFNSFCINFKLNTKKFYIPKKFIL